MASYGVNRITHSGRVAGPEQRITIDEALRAVTIGAAYSWRREQDLGSIEVGKIANFTVLADNPYDNDPRDLGRTRILGTVFEGRWFPVPLANQNARLNTSNIAPSIKAENDEQMNQSCGHGCGCEIATFLTDHLARNGFAA
jgi:adenine deaminase